MKNCDNQEVNKELITMGNAIRSLFTCLGLFNIIIYDKTRDSINFSHTDWKVIQDVKTIRDTLDKQTAKGAEEFVIVRSNYWEGSFTRR